MGFRGDDPYEKKSTPLNQLQENTKVEQQDLIFLAEPSKRIEEKTRKNHKDMPQTC